MKTQAKPWTERKLVATDEGTHGGPDTTRVYRLADGRFRTVKRHGMAVVSDDVSDKIPPIKTAGRVRHFTH